MKNYFIIYIIPILLFFVSGCNTDEIKSNWAVNKITIDGNQNDWQGKLNFIKDQNIGIGVQNDDEFLYLCFITSERSKILPIMMNGLTVWIDPENNNKKFGIKFPVGMKSDMMFDFESKQEDNYQDLGKRIKKYESSLNEFEIVGDDGNMISGLSLINDTGIQLKIGTANGQLVYELKVPLLKSEKNKFFIGTEPGKEIKLQFETGEMQKPKRTMSGENRDGFGEGRPNSGMREGGVRPGGPISRMSGRPEILDYSIDVLLSKKIQ